VEVQINEVLADQILTKSEVSTDGVPDLVSVTDLATGRIVLAPGTFPYFILGIAIAGVGLLICIILAIVFLCKKKDKGYGSMFYASMEERNARAALNEEYSSNSPLVKTMYVIALYDVTHEGEAVLNCAAGDRLIVDPEDYQGTGEWMWCRFGSREGYVPRNFVRLA
jgi:hypothetical protein